MMSDNKKEIPLRFLVLLRNDARNLFSRINERHSEFIDVFSLKRDRTVFKEIFRNRYGTMTMGELANFSIEIIELADKYYQDVDELFWYLERTQDMPNTIEDEIIRSCARLEKQLNNLLLYIDAEMGGNVPVVEDNESPDFIPTEGIFESMQDNPSDNE